MVQDVQTIIQQAGAKMRAGDYAAVQRMLEPYRGTDATVDMLYNQATQMIAVKAAQGRARAGNFRLTAVIIVLAALGVGGFLLYSFVILPYLQQQERDQTANAFGAELSALCAEVPSGRANRDNMPDGDLRALVLIGGDTRWHGWHNQLPETARATSAEDTTVVICIEEAEDEVETCTYTPSGTYTRYRREATLTFINVETGELIDRETLRGSEPSECPDSITSRSSNPSQSSYGDYVTYEQFYEEAGDILNWR